MDDFILSHTRDNAALEAMRRSIVERDGSALLCIEFYADHADELPPRLERAGPRSEGQRSRLPHAGADRRRGAGEGLEPARGRPRASRWRRVATARRFRSSKTRRSPRSGCASTSRGSSRSSSAIRRPPASTRTPRSGCLHVRPVVDMKTADGIAMFEGIANEVADLVLEFGGALSGEHGDGLVRGAFNERMFGPDAVRGVPDRQAHVRSRRALQPRPDRRHAADHRLTCASAPATQTPEPADPLRLRRARAASAARSRCAAASAPAARPARGRCARRTWRRGTRPIRRGGGPTCCAWP